MNCFLFELLSSWVWRLASFASLVSLGSLTSLIFSCDELRSAVVSTEYLFFHDSARRRVSSDVSGRSSSIGFEPSSSSSSSQLRWTKYHSYYFSTVLEKKREPNRLSIIIQSNSIQIHPVWSNSPDISYWKRPADPKIDPPPTHKN